MDLFDDPTCKICRASFSTRESLLSHIKSHHQSSVDGAEPVFSKVPVVEKGTPFDEILFWFSS